MSPVTHLFISWLVANSAKLDERDRALVTVAGIIPDIDGLGVVADVVTRNSEHFLPLYDQFHHVLAHNIGFLFLVTLGSIVLAHKRWITVLFAMLSFHIHLLGDIAGSRGPDGSQWPIPYLWPFSHSWQLTWEGQWELNAWPNVFITGISLILTLYLAWKRGYSPLEIFSSKADRVFVETLRKRFGEG